MPVTAEDVRDVALSLPRAYEAWVREHRKFRVGSLVFASVSPDETLLGFGFPREEREALVAGEPEKFLLPRPSDMRYQWVVARMEALDVEELRELVTDAWAMCVPKSVREAWFGDR
ncbi:MmcQ/YjbR family DNA-binding protein [Nocardioides pocheonensis]|uniref:MmcQ/YjbR family DNA-binding protein n=1 Tax=Nocardioides pocheonensis TaxID=661485 RepID=A0A3N0GFD9_9ACTN|nr:MmcQ/YjbR family DNA-binding protein [Nocardioides pocheonensis]RNM11179.1 MmcQ/YjbR family DNA-binding protein [Nocardioides pocheonensis]